MYDTELPIRSDLTAAHQAAVTGWSQPGTWWTAEERVAIVSEVRRARDTPNTPPAWVPVSHVAGLYDDGHLLPATAVDAIWRLTNHPGTLTQAWCDDIAEGLAQGDSDSGAYRYTELVALVAQANCIDRFAEGLSLGRPLLSEPVSGEPSRTIPGDVIIRDHWVPTDATENAAVTKALSCVPAENRMSFVLCDAQYLPVETMFELMADRNSLTRMQVELVAARTSKLNDCFY